MSKEVLRGPYPRWKQLLLVWKYFPNNPFNWSEVARLASTWEQLPDGTKRNKQYWLSVSKLREDK